MHHSWWFELSERAQVTFSVYVVSFIFGSGTFSLRSTQTSIEADVSQDFLSSAHCINDWYVNASGCRAEQHGLFFLVIKRVCGLFQVGLHVTPQQEDVAGMTCFYSSSSSSSCIRQCCNFMQLVKSLHYFKKCFEPVELSQKTFQNEKSKGGRSESIFK